MGTLWEIFSIHLFFISHAFDARIHSFVLMDNHFHLIISTPKGNISEVMQYLMTNTSLDITKVSGRINQTYGGPYYSSLITTDIHFSHCYKYVYRNPVEAGLSDCVEEYRYSTLRGLLGYEKLIFPLTEDYFLFPSLENSIVWLNSSYKLTTKEQIQKALHKNKFSFAKINSRQNPLDRTYS